MVAGQRPVLRAEGQRRDRGQGVQRCRQLVGRTWRSQPAVRCLIGFAQQGSPEGRRHADSEPRRNPADRQRAGSRRILFR